MAIDGELAFYKESQFPNLAKTEYRVTSSQTAIYNCFAWAAVQDDRWWSPREFGTGASYLICYLTDFLVKVFVLR
jgi:hypothetical protein